MTLVFHRSLYQLAAVQAAAAAYTPLCNAEVQENPHDFRVVLTPTTEQAAELGEELADHFANHVLVETVQSYRAGTGEDA